MSTFLDITNKMSDKLNSKQTMKYIGFVAITIGISGLLSEHAFAANGAVTDAFAEIHNKANGWVSGSLGKLITFASLTIAGIMGVAGFPARQVAGTVGVGLLLSSADNIVKMLFN